MQLQIDSTSEVPLYRRIADAVCVEVVAGRLTPGQKLPAHQGLARTLGVSPLTVGRGYEFLEERGIVRQRRGSGTYVQDDALERMRQQEQRRYDTIWIVLGETSPARCRRETLFIVTNMLDGLRTGLGAREAHFEYVVSFTAAEMKSVGPQDAVVLMAPVECDASLISDFNGRGIPVLKLGNDHLQIPAPSVQYDHHQAASLACRHLLQAGHRRIGFIGVKSYSHAPIAHKFYAYTSLLHDAGLDVCARYVREATVTPGRAYAAARDILNGGDLPEAFFVDTDYKAMEVITALNDAGLRVPQDIAIVAYDDVPESATFAPALTTVHIPRVELGQRAAEMLLRWPRAGALPGNITLQSELVVRASCGSVAPTESTNLSVVTID